MRPCCTNAAPGPERGRSVMLLCHWASCMAELREDPGDFYLAKNKHHVRAGVTSPPGGERRWRAAGERPPRAPRG